MDCNVDGGSNILQMEAYYPTVTIGKKIDGGETQGRDLRDEAEGVPPTAHIFYGNRLCHDRLCIVKSEPRGHR